MNDSLSFTRNDLIEGIRTELGCTLVEAKRTSELAINLMTDALRSGKRVEFRGFGAFEVITRGRKIGRNPRNPGLGNFEIPPRTVVKFKTGKELDKALNSKSEAAGAA